MRHLLSFLSLVSAAFILSCSGFVTASVSSSGSGDGSGSSSGTSNSLSQVDDGSSSGSGECFNAKREPIPCNTCEAFDGSSAPCETVQPASCTWETRNAKRETITEAISCDDERRTLCYNSAGEQVHCVVREISA